MLRTQPFHSLIVFVLVWLLQPCALVPVRCHAANAAGWLKQTWQISPGLSKNCSVYPPVQLNLWEDSNEKTLENMMAHAGHFDTLYDADRCLVADSHCQFSAGLLLGMFTQTSSIAFPSFIPVSPAFPLLGGNMVEMDNICCPCSNLKVLMLVRHQENSRTQSCNRE